MNKKNKYLITITILSLIFCNKVYALCSESELNHFKEIESQYKVTYDYDPTTKLYSITYQMPELDKYRYEFAIAGEDINCSSPEEGIVVCYGRNFNGYQEFSIIGNTNTCTGEIKKTTMTIPKYNEFYGSELCTGIEEFALCQLEYDKEITQEEFESRVETYKKTNENKNITNNNDKNSQLNGEEKNSSIINTINKYIKNNLSKIIVVFVFIILVIISIILTIISTRKSRRLE